MHAKSKGGSTPLLFAVRNDHADAAWLLLDNGAGVDEAAADGTSALNMAVVNAYFDLASMLIDRGANPNASGSARVRPPHARLAAQARSDGAAGVGNTGHAPPLPSGRMTAIELAQKLLEHGANPNVRIGWKEIRSARKAGRRGTRRTSSLAGTCFRMWARRRSTSRRKTAMSST